MSSTLYQPRADSLASQCIGFFTNNPDEHLGLEDITEKFSATRGNIHSILRPALDARFLLRERNDDGDYIYRAGPAIRMAAPAADTPRPAALRRASAPLGHKVAAPRGHASPRHCIDFENLKVDDGVPFPNIGQKGQSKWEPLFKKLGQPGQSIEVPGHVKAALAAAVNLRNKQQRGQFRVAMTSAQAARIWRLK